MYTLAFAGKVASWDGDCLPLSQPTVTVPKPSDLTCSNTWRQLPQIHREHTVELQQSVYRIYGKLSNMEEGKMCH